MKYLNHVYDFIAYSRQGKQKNTAISSQLVQIVLHHAVVYDAQTDQAQDKVQNGVILVGNTLICAAGRQLLLSQIEANERQEQKQHNENTAIGEDQH